MLDVGYLQFRPRFGKVAANLKKVLSVLDGVGADLIVLPELAFTGYHFRDRAEAAALAEDPRDSETVAALTALCRRQDLYLVTGFCERSAERIYNSALLIGPRGLEHVYRKLHLFGDETRCFDAGDVPLAVQTVRGARIGLMVCFDWAFPEVARVLTLLGAEVLCHPSNLVLGYCQQAMLTRCLENKVYAVTANRYGADKRPHGTLRFTGCSQIVAPGGRLIHRAATQREALHVATIDPAEARDKHITHSNDLLRDRRPDYYGVLSAAATPFSG
ncbi:MAG: nitrilase-related carbon-nitrogen hydrolase [Gammaproteobacteria bacterium]